jgi:tetratricopeptide (TPR) repeat protein
MTTTALEEEAVKAALTQNWPKAIEINKKILKDSPQGIAALNRLGRAYWETGKIAQAIQSYKKVLKFDILNPIANKNLKRLAKGGQAKKRSNKKNNFTPSGKIFLEEPGKTKIVKLVRLAPPSTLAQLDNADLVIMTIKKRTVSVSSSSENGNYLGAIPEDLSIRLIRLIKGGNQYQAFVKSVDHQKLEIFIREAFRAKKFFNNPSFPQGRTSFSQ